MVPEPTPDAAPVSTPDGPPPRFDRRRAAVGRALAQADGLLLCADFDGTLAAIEETPDAPTIAPTNRDALRDLTAHPHVAVAVVSGRALADVRRRVGLDGLAYAGNHGLELHRDGRTTVHPIAAKRRPAIQRLCDDLEATVGAIDGCLVENKGVTASVHYRQAPAERVPDIRSAVIAGIRRVGRRRVRCNRGKQVVEVRPTLPWDKGRAVRLLAGGRPDGWLTVYVGDDTTDEDAFEAIAGDGIGVHVGDGADTVADYRVDSPDAVEGFLDWLRTEGTAHLDER